MMTRSKATPFILIACILTACGKYPDGPEFSLRTKRARVLGEYTVELFAVNGVDSTAQLTCNDYFFRDDGHRVFSWCNHSSSGNTWDFDNHHKNIDISAIIDSTQKTPLPITLHDTFFPYNYASSLSWEIQRLTNKQMWLKTDFNGKEYYIKFLKK